MIGLRSAASGPTVRSGPAPQWLRRPCPAGSRAGRFAVATGYADAGGRSEMGASSASPESLRRLRDAAWLRGQYSDGKSRRDIARLLGVADSTVGYWLDRHSISRRSAVRARREIFERARPPELADAEWLRRRVHTDHLSITAIGELLGVSPAMVRGALSRHGIETARDMLGDADWLGAYVNRHGVAVVADMVGRTESTIYRRLKSHGLDTDGSPLHIGQEGSEWLIAADSVWEHLPGGHLIRRVAGSPTQSTRTGVWFGYRALREVVSQSAGTASTTVGPRPGRRWVIVRRRDGHGSIPVCPLVATATIPPAGLWTVREDGWVDSAAGSVCVPREEGAEAVRWLLDVAEPLPDQPGTDWYWPVSDVRTLHADLADQPEAWVVHTRHERVPLLAAGSREEAGLAARLLGRLPVSWYADIVCALVSPTGWETGPASIHLTDDRLVDRLLLEGGWPTSEVEDATPTTRREWLLDGRTIEATGIPWPRVHRVWAAIDRQQGDPR